jgi:methylmalonyl-CoA mutase
MFPPANKQSWLQQVTKDLKGAAIEPVIQWEFEKGLQAEALLFPDEATIYAYQQVLAVQNPNVAMHSWRNRMEIILSEETIANKIALESLNQGIEEIAFVLDSKQTEKVDFALLLQDILLQYCAISFEIVGNIPNFMERYLEYVKTQNVDYQSLSGSISLQNESSFYYHAGLGIGFKTVVLKNIATEDENSEQIANILTQLQTYLTQNSLENNLQNCSPKNIFDSLQVDIQIKNLYFIEIAKLRALRLLLLQMAMLYGVELEAYQLTVHAKTTLQTSNSNKIKDENQNLLSNTTQAMSAIMGACAILTITPHSTEKPSFSNRIARNIANLLREESYLDKVLEVANGAYYIEQVTDRIAEKAWNFFVAK